MPALRLREAVRADAAAVAACVQAAYAPWAERIGREPWPMLQDYAFVYLYTNEKMTGNIAMYVKAGYLEYERREELGFSRVFLRKDLR